MRDTILALYCTPFTRTLPPSNVDPLAISAIGTVKGPVRAPYTYNLKPAWVMLHVY